MLTRSLPWFLAWFFVLLPAQVAFAWTVALSEIGSSSVESATATPLDFVDAPIPQIPDTGSATSSSGGSTSITGYAVSNSVFEFTFDHSRAGASGSLAQSTANIYFSVDETVDYELEGLYTTSDVGEAGTVLLFTWLLDDTAGTFAFANTQQSGSVPDESFTLGLEEGNVDNALEGSLTGTLIAGHEYELSVWSYIESSSGDSGATATGSVRLHFVPEPSAVSQLAAGLAGLLGLARRRKQGA
jgi:hypothetical protein